MLDPMTTISPSAERAVLDAVPTQLFIGGQWRDGTGGGTLPVEDPATGETLVAADEAFRTFRGVAPRDRGEILRRAYELMVERTEDLALLMTLEMGKAL